MTNSKHIKDLYPTPEPSEWDRPALEPSEKGRLLSIFDCLLFYLLMFIALAFWPAVFVAVWWVVENHPIILLFLFAAVLVLGAVALAVAFFISPTLALRTFFFGER